VELLLTTDGTGFEFIPDSSAMKFIEETIKAEGWEDSQVLVPRDHHQENGQGE